MQYFPSQLKLKEESLMKFNVESDIKLYHITIYLISIYCGGELFKAYNMCMILYSQNEKIGEKMKKIVSICIPV